MTVEILLKRGTGVPGSLAEGEPAIDLGTNRIFVGGSGGTSVVKIADPGSTEFFQGPVLDIQEDGTLDPGASPTKGDRYLITDIATLHANFGTITGVGDGDVVEYNGTDFVVVFDASVKGEGAILWDEDSNQLYSYNGTAWARTVTLQDAYENSEGLGTIGTTGITTTTTGGGFAVFSDADITGNVATSSLLAGATGTATVDALANLVALSGAVVNDQMLLISNQTTALVPAIEIESGDGAALRQIGLVDSKETTLVGDSPQNGDFWYNTTSNQFKYWDAVAAAVKTIATLEKDQTFSGDLTFSTGLNLTDTTQDVYTIVTPTGGFNASTSLVNKGYVDSVAAGLDPKESVNAATTQSLESESFGASGITYSSGAGTLTQDVPGDGAFGTIDGVTISVGERVLVKNQTDAKENGIYTLTEAGDGASTAWVLTRAADMDGDIAAEVSGGNFTFVEQGTANSGSGWVVVGDGVLTVDDATLGNNDDIVWSQFSESTSITGGEGIDVTSGTISLDFSSLTADAIAAADVLAFFDNDGTDHNKITFSNFEGSLTLDNLAGTLSVSKGGTGLTTVAKGTVLVANAVDTVSALDGSTEADNSATVTSLLGYQNGTDDIVWTTKIDGGSF